MAKIDDPSENGLKLRSKRWQGRLIALLLLAAGTIHAVKPKWLSLDWPSIALILTGILLLFLPLDDLGSVVESLEIGKTKILFRKVKQLDESVEQAIKEEVSASNVSRSTIPNSVRGITPDEDYQSEGTEETARKDREGSLLGKGLGWVPPKGRTDDMGSRPDTGEGRDLGGLFSSSYDAHSPNPLEDPRLYSLFQADKEMALIRIGIEIEQELTELYRSAGGKVTRVGTGLIWYKAIEFLEAKGLIAPATSHALIQFRNVRNQLIHPSAGKVLDSLVTSAVDSGIKLLRILSNIREMDNKSQRSEERAGY